MRPQHKKFCTLLVAALSLLFLSVSPQKPLERRHLSSVCDPTAAEIPGSAGFSLPAYFREAMANQSQDSFSIFRRQLELNMQLLSLGSSSPFSVPLPSFPSYALPQVANYQIDMTKPDTSHLGFGGLYGNPDLKFLVQPAASPAVSPLAGASAAPAVAAGNTTFSFLR